MMLVPWCADIEEENIRIHFEDCGEIENVRVIRDRKTNLGKGFCYILFKVNVIAMPFFVLMKKKRKSLNLHRRPDGKRVKSHCHLVIDVHTQTNIHTDTMHSQFIF